jgi:glucose-6-phosphate 1-dehydrogenase
LISSKSLPAEGLGVGSRAGYYEGVGALRDMVANHLLQLLTLTAMEPPVAFDADSVREEKVQVLRSIRRLKPEEVAVRTVRAQYDSGTIDGEQVKSYKDEDKVDDNSTTETYSAIEFHVSNWRWSGVPILRSHRQTTRQKRYRDRDTPEAHSTGIVCSNTRRTDRTQRNRFANSTERGNYCFVRGKTSRV